ncbi:G-patch domain and KOW motifs-containing protein [Phascolarctos cinereus]|uniref:G-patch domain and KOW motifs-containing protein n=1 Tax=Phascolarctos cinereus TaxID=38626 RepID=A0A6P5LRG6_PHACI|nr:G patch domain and KOW motifs-containing protein [Phascolarctos cinereus]
MRIERLQGPAATARKQYRRQDELQGPAATALEQEEEAERTTKSSKPRTQTSSCRWGGLQGPAATVRVQEKEAEQTTGPSSQRAQTAAIGEADYEAQQLQAGRTTRPSRPRAQTVVARGGGLQSPAGPARWQKEEGLPKGPGRQGAAGGAMAHDESEAAAARSPAPGPPAPLSFGFSRTAGRKRLAEGREGQPEEEKDFVRAVEGRELRSVRPPEEAPRELVIPLLRRGHGRGAAPGQAALPEDGVLRQAVEELIEESKRALQPGPGAEAAASAVAIPLLARAGDAAEAPESVGADYEAVPVEAYGLAMLRGMGWRPGEGIGRTFKQVVKPRENPLRPKGLGLGASLAPPAGPPGPSQPGGREAEEPVGLAPGRAVQVLAGPHRGRYGKVQGLDPDNARAVVKLAPAGPIATLSEHVLRPVPAQEYERQARAPGYPEPGRRGAPEKKRRKQSPAEERRAPHWLRRDLRVRFVDRRHREGRYYNTKMTIEDVLSPDTCVCRTDEGRLLEGLREDMLETLIPKEEKARVMVVLGPHRGQVGRLLGRDKEKSRALVQLLQEEAEGTVLQLDYDAVCQYVGPAAED